MVEIERLWNILDSLFTFFSNFYQKMACFTTKLIPEFSLSCDNKFWVCSHFNSFKKSRSIDYFSNLSLSAIKFWVRSRQVCLKWLCYPVMVYRLIVVWEFLSISSNMSYSFHYRLSTSFHRITFLKKGCSFIVHVFLS